jgi:hypothetical protein
MIPREGVTLLDEDEAAIDPLPELSANDAAAGSSWRTGTSRACCPSPTWGGALGVGRPSGPAKV